MIRLKRVYEPATPEDGTRLLVERSLPRGVKNISLCLDAWVKQVAPSALLRRWFGHDQNKWDEFQRRYVAELDKQVAAWEPILKAAQNCTVTLINSSHVAKHNNAMTLKEYLESKLPKDVHQRSSSNASVAW